MKINKTINLCVAVFFVGATAFSQTSLFADLSPGQKSVKRSNNADSMMHMDDDHNDMDRNDMHSTDSMSKKHKQVYHNFSRKDKQKVDDAHENGVHPHTKIAEILHNDSKNNKVVVKKNMTKSPGEKSIDRHAKHTKENNSFYE